MNSGAGSDLFSNGQAEGSPVPPADPAVALPQRARYLKPLREYEGLYDTETRNMKRWISIGRAAGELPPLDAPGEMAAWWSRRMKQRVPTKLLQIANSKPSIPEGGDEKTVKTAPVSSCNVTTGRQSLEQMSSLERIRREEFEAYQRFITANNAAEPNVGEVEMRQRSWERLVEQRRKLEKDAAEGSEARGESMSRSEIVRELKQIHGAIAQQVRNLYRRARPQLRMAKSEPEEDQIWDVEVDQMFGALSNVFA